VPFEVLAGAPLDVFADVFGGAVEVAVAVCADSLSFVDGLRAMGSELS
jgi:hypothetical protein